MKSRQKKPCLPSRAHVAAAAPAALLFAVAGCAEESQEPARLGDRAPLTASAEAERLAGQAAARSAPAIGLRFEGGLRLESVSNEAGAVLFEFRMAADADGLRPPTREALLRARMSLAAHSCRTVTPLERAVLTEGGALQYRYLAASGRAWHELELRREDCAPHWRGGSGEGGEGSAEDLDVASEAPAAPEEPQPQAPADSGAAPFTPPTEAPAAAPLDAEGG